MILDFRPHEYPIIGLDDNLRSEDDLRSLPYKIIMVQSNMIISSFSPTSLLILDGSSYTKDPHIIQYTKEYTKRKILYCKSHMLTISQLHYHNYFNY